MTMTPQTDRADLLTFRNNASLSYQTSLTSLRAMPRSTALQYADRIYADMHLADQTRRLADKYLRRD